MTEQEKKLLTRDLSGRIPYGVKVVTNHTISQHHITVETITVRKRSQFLEGIYHCLIRSDHPYMAYIEDVKPYLFPLDSLSDEEKAELKELRRVIKFSIDDNGEEAMAKVLEYLNERHIDYNRLIEKGLAIDATDKNIY